jgi:hypothetical protein
MKHSLPALIAGLSFVPDRTPEMAVVPLTCVGIGAVLQ